MTKWRVFIVSYTSNLARGYPSFCDINMTTYFKLPSLWQLTKNDFVDYSANISIKIQFNIEKRNACGWRYISTVDFIRNRYKTYARTQSIVKTKNTLTLWSIDNQIFWTYLNWIFASCKIWHFYLTLFDSLFLEIAMQIFNKY